MDLGGSKEPCIRWRPRSSTQKGNYQGKWHAQACATTLPWAVQKWLNRSICCLHFWLGWAEGSTSSITFCDVTSMCPHWCNLANMTEPSVYSGNAALFLFNIILSVLSQCWLVQFLHNKVNNIMYIRLPSYHYPVPDHLESNTCYLYHGWHIRKKRFHTQISE